jgi:hypothetical protein
VNGKSLGTILAFAPSNLLSLRRALRFAAFKKAFNREGRKEMPQVRQEESSGKTEFGKNNERRTNI